MTGFAAADSATKQSQGNGITAEDIAASGAVAPEDTARYALTLGDDALILAQRLGWWISRAPEMEEDIALGNIALDLIGHARFLLTMPAPRGAKPRMIWPISATRRSSALPA